jgi:hypothetical protein
MKLTFHGYTSAPSPGSTGCWWFAFHQVLDIPEAFVQSKGGEYLTYFFKGLAHIPSAITQFDIDEFISHYSTSGGLRAGFEYYKSLPQNAKDNKELATTSKFTMPLLAL